MGTCKTSNSKWSQRSSLDRSSKLTSKWQLFWMKIKIQRPNCCCWWKWVAAKEPDNFQWFYCLVSSMKGPSLWTQKFIKMNQFNKSEVWVSYLQHWNDSIPQFVFFKVLKSSKLPFVVVWHFRYTFLVSASITNLWQQLNSSCINTVTRHVECSSLTLHICNLIRCFQFVQNR